MKISFDAAVEVFSLPKGSLKRLAGWCFGPSWTREDGIELELFMKPYGDNIALALAAVNGKDVLLTHPEACKVYSLSESALLRWARKNPDAVIKFPARSRYSFLRLAEWRKGVKLK